MKVARGGPATRTAVAALAAVAVFAAARSIDAIAAPPPLAVSAQRIAGSPGDRVWPDPPELARIQFLRTLTPTRPGGHASLFRRLWAVITGDDSRPVMTQPYGLAVARGRLYVADTYGRALHVFDLVKGGSERIEIDADSLVGVAVLGSSLYVTDSASGQLFCLDMRGRRRWTLGRHDGFERPTGIAAADDRLFVVDTAAHCVVIVAAEGRILGRFGSQGMEPGQLNYPTNIVRDLDGRLCVTDSMNFRVQIFTSTGRYVGSFGRLGDGSGDFNRPKGIAVDSDGHIYVVEGLADVVQIFSGDGRFLLAFGESGTRDGQLWLPSGIAIADDVIYVADSANRRVQVFKYLKETQQ